MTNKKFNLETPDGGLAMRIIDLLAPIGKGQRGLIVSPPKAGKTTLLKSVANSIIKRTRTVKMIILLIDERPEEVTDLKTLSKNTRHRSEWMSSTPHLMNFRSIIHGLRKWS